MIWVVGGGPKSHQICQQLKQLKKPYKLTTITDYKRDMPLSYTSKALSKPLQEEEINAFIEKEGITAVIDHTYDGSSAFSRKLMAICEQKDVMYIRYEEKTLIDEVMALHENVEVVSSLHPVEKALKNYEAPIFLDLNRKVQKEIAYLNLKKCFYKEAKTAFDAESLKKQFEKNHITKVFVCENENLPLYIKVCDELKLPLIVMKRNKLNYKRKCYDLSALEEYLQGMPNSGNIEE